MDLCSFQEKLPLLQGDQMLSEDLSFAMSALLFQAFSVL